MFCQLGPIEVVDHGFTFNLYKDHIIISKLQFLSCVSGSKRVHMVQ